MKKCLMCNFNFQEQNDWQRFCNPVCRLRYNRKRRRKMGALGGFQLNGLRLHDALRGFEYKVCCYGWFRDNEYIYIGATKQLRQRLINHQTVGRIEPFLETDELHLWEADENNLWKIERQLISMYKPKFNDINWRPEDFMVDVIPKAIKFTPMSNVPRKLRWQHTNKKKVNVFHVY